MRIDRAPATVIVCVRVPSGTTPDAFAPWADVADRAGVPITWAARPAEMPVVTTMLGRKATACDVALALDPQHLLSRPTLRGEIAAARAIAGGVECAVVSGTPVLDHRALLVEQGIHTVAVGGFDNVTRSSRRPPPTGWPCRSVVWGLWEVRAVPQPPMSAWGRMLPWALAPNATPGSLIVVHAEPGKAADRSALAKLERLTGWMARQRARLQGARLSDLYQLLGAAGQPKTGSVLRRAA